ncbi:MAG: RHS repeat domain-containing protein, partial [Planctomycetota bacterium]
MLKKNLLAALVLLGALFVALWGGCVEGAVGEPWVTIFFGTDPVEEFSRVKVYRYDGGKTTIDVKLPGYIQFYVLSRPLGFMPGWSASIGDSNRVTVHSPEGLRYVYHEDRSYMLDSIRRADDVNIVEFEYDGSYRPIKQTDACDPNLYIEYEYNVSDKLDRLICRDNVADVNRIYDIEYSNGLVSAITDGSCGCGAGTVEYEFDGNGFVKEERNYDTEEVIYEYERYADGRIKRIWIGPNDVNNRMLEVDLGGAAEEAVFDIYGYVDANSYRVTREYRNTAGIVTKRISYEDPNEDPDNPAGQTFTEHIVHIYSKNNVLVRKVTIPPKAQADDPPDPNSGIRKEYIYDPNTGKLLTETWYDANDANFTVSEYEYLPDPCGLILGRVKYYTDARGATTEYFYDGNDTDPNFKLMPEVSEGISGQRQLKYEYEHDPDRNWITLEKQIDESNTVLVQTKYEYDNWGNLAKRYDDYGGASEEVAAYKYNGFNEMTRMMLPSGVVQGRSYDVSGRLESEFILEDADDFNEPNDLACELISQTKYIYDANGRVGKVGRALSETAFDFNDPCDGWIYTEYKYDLWGNRIEVIEDSGDGGLELKTTYEYNN